MATSEMKKKENTCITKLVTMNQIWVMVILVIELSCFCVDCETKALGGEVCVASFDWKCSGICKSVERMSEVHQKCAENETSLWTGSF